MLPPGGRKWQLNYPDLCLCAASFPVFLTEISIQVLPFARRSNTVCYHKFYGYGPEDTHKVGPNEFPFEKKGPWANPMRTSRS